MISLFIPIRKNSKRIKNKSIRKIGNFKFGLTDIKINQSQKLKNIFGKEKIKIEFIVSTDSQKVKNYIKRFKWIRLHNRPIELASDDCLDKLIMEVPRICRGDYILWTHVTSPCFDHNCYYQFVKEFLKNKQKHKSAFSADLIGTYIMNKKSKWISHNHSKKKWPRTQDLENHFSVNSAAFIAKKSVYINNKDRLCNKPLPLLAKKGSGFDIDTKEDLIFFKKNFYNSLKK